MTTEWIAALFAVKSSPFQGEDRWGMDKILRYLPTPCLGKEGKLRSSLISIYLLMAAAFFALPAHALDVPKLTG